VLQPDQSWSVTVSFTEDGDRTRADAILELASQRFHGFGQAKLAPHDPSVPVIGQDLAAARALSDLLSTPEVSPVSSPAEYWTTYAG
jgi:hypothetical protein